MQTTPSTIQYMGIDFLANVKTAAEKAKIPVAIHLDHGSDYGIAMQSLRTGYTSIMIDGSHKILKIMLQLQRQLQTLAGIRIELGRAGDKEDDWMAEM